MNYKQKAYTEYINNINCSKNNNVKIKKVIDECYCKYISKQQNEELYKEISDLLGLYAYTKDKINIKSYVIIGR